MTQDNHITPVLFRVERNNQRDLTAVFPTLPASEHGWLMTCYAHIGQHSACAMDWYNSTRPATAEEYKVLHTELESVGYRLKVYKRITAESRGQFVTEQERLRAL